MPVCMEMSACDSPSFRRRLMMFDVDVMPAVYALVHDFRNRKYALVH